MPEPPGANKFGQFQDGAIQFSTSECQVDAAGYKGEPITTELLIKLRE